MKKLILKSFAFAAAAVALFSCKAPVEEALGQKTDALPSEAWEVSKWISAADAPVVTDIIKDGSRAADGSSWFLSTVKNGKKVASAKWMTAGLGVYELYVNGKPIGEEFLKPGFTHSTKTKRTFTYDITPALKLNSGAENVLSVEVAPGWWGDKIVTPAKHEGMVGKKCAFRGVLSLT
ncbi:MAG: alpha-L-rhamnosidase N-terminal domain-containing protein, partial [Bacteroidales bacterium]|nr:alpha-L-rhamnosidase N-terminal domain-containing protein [Bacteroidales bacterium]